MDQPLFERKRSASHVLRYLQRNGPAGSKRLAAVQLTRVLHTRRNILVSGGTGSGKTTLLNALIELLPDDERIVAIEDTLELRIDSPNCVRFEARGVQQGAVSIRDLVRHALRHRPDHIVVGEVRGGEAADLLQALNTGHGGSLTTVHANNAESALSRLASCAMQGGSELPWDVTCRGVVDGIAMVIHMTRRERRRFVEEAAYVNGYAGCRRLPGLKRRFQCRCRRDPSGCRLGEANQDAVFQRVIMGRGEGGPRIEAHGPAARKEAMGCVSALPIDRRRPYRRRRPGARIQPG